VALDGRLAGVYEDHTNRLDGPLLESYVRRFLAGDLPSDEVRQAGGSLPVSFPAPFGDMMMTGPVGLLRAFLARSA